MISTTPIANLDSSAVRDELRLVKRLYIRLLYCRDTFNRYEASPNEVLISYGVPLKYRNTLPQMNDPGFHAERYGRSAMTASELLNIYRQTFSTLLGSDEVGISVVQKSDWFQNYLASKYFFDPEWSLEHPFGIGRGYEGASRFFFWLRESYGLRSGNYDHPLRTAAYREFAIYVISQLKVAQDQSYEVFRKGFFWRTVSGSSSYTTAIFADHRVFEAKDERLSTLLADAGLVDLDRYFPPGKEP